LNQYDEAELVTTFQEQINLANEIEAAKADLAIKSDFTLEDAFGMFDLEDAGYVTTLEIEETLRSLGLSFYVDEVRLFIKHFSPHSGTRLNFDEFSQTLLPKNRELARVVRSRLPFNAIPVDRRRVFGGETQVLLNRVFRLHLDAERTAERLRQRLSRIPSFNLYDAFRAVDKSNDGVITLDEFRSILRDHGLYATEKDLESLMERYDKDRDGRVSYSEFVQEVRPKSPSKY
jgi:Ca2+-binding EF-hand superfamily protein